MLSYMNKEELIKYIQSLPEDINVFYDKNGDYNDVSIVIFTIPKSKEFYNWYFGM